jgi:hypothetical protein
MIVKAKTTMGVIMSFQVMNQYKGAPLYILKTKLNMLYTMARGANK